MPELPEVEVLVRHLRPLLTGRTVRQVEVRRAKTLGGTALPLFQRSLKGACFKGLERRGKYLLFELEKAGGKKPLRVVGHLGMTGRMYLQPLNAALPKHAVVVLKLNRDQFVFEDTRYFGRFTLETESLDRLGPEPLGCGFTVEVLTRALQGSRQAIKVKLLDQSFVAGVGNIYASEALFRARVMPTLPANRLTPAQREALWRSVREVLKEAIAFGSTVPLNYTGQGGGDGLFYYGRMPGAAKSYEERLRVYDRAGLPCLRCGEKVRRLVQAARSTYFCPRCQKGGKIQVAGDSQERHDDKSKKISAKIGLTAAGHPSNFTPRFSKRMR